MFRISNRSIKVHCGVESMAGTNPLIHSSPHRLHTLSNLTLALRGCDSCAHHSNAMSVGPRDELTVARDKVVAGDRVSGIHLAVADYIVNRLQKDDPLHAGPAEHVAVEPGKGAHTSVIPEHLIALHALIHYGNVGGRLIR